MRVRQKRGALRREKSLAPRDRHERVKALDARGPDALLDPVRDRVSQVEGPLLVDTEDEPYATLAVWRAYTTLGSDREAVADGVVAILLFERCRRGGSQYPTKRNYVDQHGPLGYCCCCC